MKVLKILIILLVLLMSVGAISAADTFDDDNIISDDNQNALETSQEDEIYTNTDPVASFTDLSSDIENAGDSFDIQHNYKFNNESDDSNGITIAKDNFVLNGGGFTIDADNQARIFNITGKNVTINNLTFLNAKFDSGSALQIDSGDTLYTNYVTFENCTAEKGVVAINGAILYSNYDKIIDCTSTSSGVIYVNGYLIANNSVMTSSKLLSWGFVSTPNNSQIQFTNSIFANATSNYTTAVRGGAKTNLINCQFINLEALITGGAVGLKEVDSCKIINCTFINITSDKNGGAVFSDVIGYQHSNDGYVLINGTNFINCSSGFGGAILHLGGNLTIINSNFTGNDATFDGGALYVSTSIVKILDSNFIENSACYQGERGSYGGAIYADCCEFEANNTNFTCNYAYEGCALYLYDVEYTVANAVFSNNIKPDCKYNDIFAVFCSDASVLEGNTYSSNDSLKLDEVNYATISAFEGMNITLINNTIEVTTLPSRFDLRDWGWVTSVKDQGHMGSCWTFGSTGAMESTILRFLGLNMDLSENNMQDVGLMYYMYGIMGTNEGASAEAPANYALSWFGVFNEDYDVYDQLGKISPIFATNNSIHFQDIVIIPPRKNATDNDALKEAILKYGGLFINYYAMGSALEQYYDGDPDINHGVTLVGWDDDREIAGAPDKGAWIIKNSWGTSVGEGGYMYISYYDTSLSTITNSYAYILDNTLIYNKNYQYDLQGMFSYLNTASEYRNTYLAVDDDLIAAVGTYFNESNVAYTIEIYVNDVLKLTQTGLSPFGGFHTVKLDSYVPIKKGDEFTVLIKSNLVPILSHSRQHYIDNSSQYYLNGQWFNANELATVCCIKAYTLKDDTKVINNNNINVDYDGGSYFSVKVVTDNGHIVGAGEIVKFTINKHTYTATTDKDGIAKLKITDVPGKYTITTTYNGKTYKNTVNVKQVLTTSKVTVKSTAKKFTLQAKLKINGKLVKGKTISFKLNGKTYRAKTGSNGVAKVTIKNNLKKGKTYAVKVTYLKDTINSSVKVK